MSGYERNNAALPTTQKLPRGHAATASSTKKSTLRCRPADVVDNCSCHGANLNCAYNKLL
jgi:hypothetical protein